MFTIVLESNKSEELNVVPLALLLALVSGAVRLSFVGKPDTLDKLATGIKKEL